MIDFAVFLYMPLRNTFDVSHVEILQASYLAAMRTVSASKRSIYDALLNIYREAAEPREKSLVLGLRTFL